MNKNTKKLLKLTALSLALSSVCMPSVKAEGEENYKIKEGDTLSEISYKFYGTTIYTDALANYNNIEDKDIIRKGRTIVIPSVHELMEKYEIEDDDIRYTIQKGDSLYSICKDFYNTGSIDVINKLATYNHLADPDTIVKGNVLLIPSYDKLLEVDAINYVDTDVVRKDCKCPKLKLKIWVKYE